MSRVDVAMSGGVDSSVAAALLLERGLDVRGVTMRLLDTGWHEAEDTAAVVCEALGIPHRVIDLSAEFESAVLGPYAKAYAGGLTPNPCVACNESVKFGALVGAVLSDGADVLATGHYARVVEHACQARLAQGADRSKDQAYFLYRLTRETLSKIAFPLGDLRKSESRALAAKRGLPVHDAPESQDACFAREKSPAEIVAARCAGGFESGDVVTESGAVLGRHSGIARYTVGQRRGLGISASEALYVREIRSESNEVVVAPREALAASWIRARDVVWHDESTSGSCAFRHRYGGTPQSGTYSLLGDTLEVVADDPVWAVAPGQALVCYKGEIVLGGGTITEWKQESP